MKYLTVFLALLLAGCNFPIQGKEGGIGAVTISWNAVPGANIYGVFQYRTADEGTQKVSGSQSTTSTSITFYPTEDTYYYTVAAFPSLDQPILSAAQTGTVTVIPLHRYELTAMLP